MCQAPNPDLLVCRTPVTKRLPRSAVWRREETLGQHDAEFRNRKQELEQEPTELLVPINQIKASASEETSSPKEEEDPLLPAETSGPSIG